jgi:CRISPR-associated endonuclease Csy4
LGSEGDVRKIESETREHPVFSSYALITTTSAIPAGVAGYVVNQRLHVKGTSDYRRLEKRHKARGTWTPELAQEIAEKYRQATICPHVGLKSSSTGQRFLLFVQQARRKEPVDGGFNAYGLSVDGATVPLF